MNGINNIMTPCHVIDLDVIQENLSGPIKYIREKASCNILLALKGFSSPEVLKYMVEHLDGASASGEFEARLGKEMFKKHICTYSPSYKDESIDVILQNSSHIVFNSMRQFSKYQDMAYKNNVSCGIRINPDFSLLPALSITNPCQKYSRLGVKYEDMPNIDLFGEGKIEGIHLHTMCDQGAEALEKTIDYLISNYSQYLHQIKWLNLGGGQMYAQLNYDLKKAVTAINKLHRLYDFEIFLEPCSGIITNCGYFITTVTDIVKNEMDIAIIDASTVCHMPDVILTGWEHDISNAGEIDAYPYKYRIAGCSCFAGDIWGDYSFSNPLSIGDHIIFEDTAAYSIVKNNSFNGLQIPAIATYSKKDGIKIVKTFNYNTFISNQ